MESLMSARGQKRMKCIAVKSVAILIGSLGRDEARGQRSEAVRARPSYVALDLGRGVIIVQIYGDAWSSFK